MAAEDILFFELIGSYAGRFTETCLFENLIF